MNVAGVCKKNQKVKDRESEWEQNRKSDIEHKGGVNDGVSYVNAIMIIIL